MLHTAVWWEDFACLEDGRVANGKVHVSYTDMPAVRKHQQWMRTACRCAGVPSAEAQVAGRATSGPLVAV